MRQIVVREQVPVAPPVMWARETNMPPAEWFRGKWYAQKVMEQRKKKRRERREKIMQAVLLVGMVAFMIGACWFMGGM